MRKLWLIALVVQSVCIAAPLEVGLALNGDVRLGETGLTMDMNIHGEHWEGLARGSNRSFKFPDPKQHATNVEFFMNDKKCATGRISLQAQADGTALVEGSLVATCEQRPESVVMSVEFPSSIYGGSHWKSSTGKTGVFEKVWDGKAVGLYNEWVDWVEITSPVGETIRFNFPKKVPVMFQDNRTWGSSFSLRTYNYGRTHLKPGDKREFVCVISSPDKTKVTIDKPVVLKDGEDWIKLDYRKDIEAGSALDFSNQGLQDAPAGKYGWLKNVNGHFEFENRPNHQQRFYGVNLCFDASFPDHDFADQLVTRIVRLGYNTVRIHHYESGNGVIKGAKDGVTLNPERMDKIDYLLAKFIEKGVYVTTDLFTCRPIYWRQLGEDRDGRVNQQVYKNLVPVHEGAFKDWSTFTRNLLSHVNPYTGRAYKDEPGLPLISLINEGHLAWCWNEIRNEKCMQKAWRDWLVENRAKDPKFAEGVSDDATKVQAWGNPAFTVFMAFIEKRMVARQKEFMRSIGVKALLTNQNCGTHFPPLMAVREELYDYVDDHFYVDHPHFLVHSWSLPSRCGNENPVKSAKLPPVACAFTRMATKPFCITEWNFSGPGMYRGVGGIMTGSLAALQGWDGLWRFAYSHSLDGMYNQRGFPGYFDVASDPLGQAGDRASVCLFLRGDMPVLADMLVNTITPDMLTTDNKLLGVVPAWQNAAWNIRTATEVAPVKGVQHCILSKEYLSEKAPVELKPNPSIAFDRERGTFSITTPKTSGGFTPSGKLEAGVINFDVGNVAATVWASSLDGKPISESKRLLVTHLTDVQANGNVYADKAKQILLHWGSYPPIVRNGTAEIKIKLNDAAAYTVWALDTTGHRVEKMSSHVENGALVFTAAVKGTNDARLLYEVVR